MLSGKVTSSLSPCPAHTANKLSVTVALACHPCRGAQLPLHATAAQGGVGKSTFSAQLAWAISGMDKQVRPCVSFSAVALREGLASGWSPKGRNDGHRCGMLHAMCDVVWCLLSSAKIPRYTGANTVLAYYS